MYLYNLIPSTSILEVLILMVPALFAVAFVTVAERKTMASMQRRIGPNYVGYYGLLQAFADALKLLLKEFVAPSQADIILFFIGPMITLVFSLLAYSVIPFAPGITLFECNIGILYILALSSISTYGILLAGWSANSKYAFLGSLRSTAQLISYELILTSVVLLVVILTGSLNLLIIIENQKIIWLLFPLFPLFVIFFISTIAETNRAPFDLAEAESELVSGFMTEHSSVIFVFFFLAEYASIVLMCILVNVLFLGGYLFEFFNIISEALLYLFKISTDNTLTELSNYEFLNIIMSNPLIRNMYCSIIIGLKTCLMIFTFILVRAAFPRIRYDQLMSFCWKNLLPIIVGLLLFMPCLSYGIHSYSITCVLL